MSRLQADPSCVLSAVLDDNGRFNISGLDLDVSLISDTRHSVLAATITGHAVGLEVQLSPDLMNKVGGAIRGVIAGELTALVEHYRLSIEANR